MGWIELDLHFWLALVSLWVIGRWCGGWLGWQCRSWLACLKCLVGVRAVLGFELLCLLACGFECV